MERKSPPGPRETVQEHDVVHTNAMIQFIGEGEAIELGPTPEQMRQQADEPDGGGA